MKELAALAFATLVVAAAPLQAQYAGISIGQTSSTLSWDYRTTPECDCISKAAPSQSRRSASIGGSMQWRGGRWVGFETEVRYMPKGYGAATQPTLNVDYLEFPVLLRLGKLTDASSRVGAFLEGGAAPALRLRCSLHSASPYAPATSACGPSDDAQTDWSIRRTDISAVAGVGAAFRFDTGLLIVGARAEPGLRDIGPAGSPSATTTNMAAILYASWLWKLGHDSSARGK